MYVVVGKLVDVVATAVARKVARADVAKAVA